MEGGELFQRIQDHNDGAFTERGKFKIFLYFINLVYFINILDIYLMQLIFHIQ